MNGVRQRKPVLCIRKQGGTLPPPPLVTAVSCASGKRVWEAGKLSLSPETPTSCLLLDHDSHSVLGIFVTEDMEEEDNLEEEACWGP